MYNVVIRIVHFFLKGQILVTFLSTMYNLPGTIHVKALLYFQTSFDKDNQIFISIPFCLVLEIEGLGQSGQPFFFTLQFQLCGSFGF